MRRQRPRRGESCRIGVVESPTGDAGPALLQHGGAGSPAALSNHCQVVGGVMPEVGHAVVAAGDRRCGVIYGDLEGRIPAPRTGPRHEEAGDRCVWTATL